MAYQIKTSIFEKTYKKQSRVRKHRKALNIHTIMHSSYFLVKVSFSFLFDAKVVDDLSMGLLAIYFYFFTCEADLMSTK